jgi:tRNA dimethylallyltransferase
MSGTAIRGGDIRGGAGPAATRKVLIVAGPTASGKSSLAAAIAAELGGIVINADSMQIYRELPILTAQPGPEARACAPHRLYGLLAASDPCSAGRWRALALAEIAAAQAAGRLPVLCGGSGLYLSALTEGLAAIPAIPATVRQAGQVLFEALGGEEFHARLAARDPITAGALRPSDGQRLVRAWEVLEATGRPLALWQSDAAEGPPADLSFAAIMLDPPRPELYRACDLRLERMIEAGVLEELRAFLASGPDPGWPLMKAVGLPELARHLAGELALPDAVARAQQATRRYAKRQVTWLRGHAPAVELLIVKESPFAQLSERISPGIFNFIRQIG